MGTYRRILAMTLAAVAATTGLAACGSGDSNAGDGKAIQIWEGYTGAEAKAFAHLVALYDKTHPGVTVQSLFVNNDNTLTKVQAAVRGGTPPDIAYLYGSWAPNVAKINSVVTLTNLVKKP